jgi:hypothetical protein
MSNLSNIPGMWKTKAGLEIPLADLLDDHLLNIYYFLHRHGFAIYIETCWDRDKFDDDFTKDIVKQSWRSFYHPRYFEILNEISKRQASGNVFFLNWSPLPLLSPVPPTIEYK